MTMSKQNKVILALEQFADSRNPAVIDLGQRLTNIPDEMQEAIWELVINYILATAAREKGWTPTMDIFIQQARDIRKVL